MYDLKDHRLLSTSACEWKTSGQATEYSQSETARYTTCVLQIAFACAGPKQALCYHEANATSRRAVGAFTLQCVAIAALLHALYLTRHLTSTIHTWKSHSRI